MARDLKYGTVTVESDPGFGEDEIVVVFRSRDKLLGELLSFYKDICLREGSTREHIEGIDRNISVVKRWQHDNVDLVKAPD